MKLRRLALILLLALASLLSCAQAETGRTLQLPASLGVIEAEAFYGDTSLNRVIFPSGVTRIGEKAFANSSVTAVVLPNTLTSIGANAFSGCAALKEIHLPDNISEIGANALKGIPSKGRFARLGSQTAVTLSRAGLNFRDPSNTKASYKYLFEGSSVLGLQFEFADTDIASITFPEGTHSDRLGRLQGLHPPV